MVNIVCVMVKTGEGDDRDGGYSTPGNTPGCGKMPPTERPGLRDTHPMKLCCDLGREGIWYPADTLVGMWVWGIAAKVILFL